MNASSVVAPSVSLITLTERAAEQINRLRQQVDAPDCLLRMWVQESGCSGLEYGIGFDTPQEGDIQVHSNGVDFVIDGSSLVYLKGAVIDFNTEGPDGTGFEIKNPNANNTCGCGKSFS